VKALRSGCLFPRSAFLYAADSQAIARMPPWACDHWLRPNLTEAPSGRERLLPPGRERLLPSGLHRGTPRFRPQAPDACLAPDRSLVVLSKVDVVSVASVENSWNAWPCCCASKSGRPIPGGLPSVGRGASARGGGGGRQPPSVGASSCWPHCMARRGNSERATHSAILLNLFASGIATSAPAEHTAPLPAVGAARLGLRANASCGSSARRCRRAEHRGASRLNPDTRHTNHPTI